MDMTHKGLGREAAESRQLPPLVPAVDIWEDTDGIHLVADLPGVAKESLTLAIDGDNLTLEGAVNLGESQQLQDVYAEVRVAQYRRSFVLGADLDKEKIAASMKDGVLQLNIPKLEAAKPRRVPVQAG